MSRFRPRGAKKKEREKTVRGLLPCLFVLIGGLIVVFLLFYAFMNSGK
jgi:hypothetical protein